MSTIPFMMFLAAAGTIVATILAYIYVIPEKCKDNLPPIGKFAHNLFNFKELYLEKIFKGLYVLATIGCIVTGVAMLFSFAVYDSYYGTYSTWLGGYGVLLALLGPVVVRITFEFTMMFILLVKNVIQINNKLSCKKEDIQQPEAPVAPAPAQEPATEVTTE